MSYLPYDFFDITETERMDLLLEVYKEFTVSENVKKEIETELLRKNIEDFLEKKCDVIIQNKKKAKAKAKKA